MREEEDAKHERDKILKSRYNDVIKEVGKRIKWDLEIKNDLNNVIGNKNKNKIKNKNESEDKNEIKNENDEERSRTKNRALAITHSLLSTYPQLLYE